MQEFCESIDLSVLESKEIIQVCIGSYQTILNMTDDVAVTIESTCDFLDVNGDKITLAGDNPEHMARLTALLGTVILKVQSSNNGDAQLDFSGGFTLCVRNSNKDTESYSVSSPEGSLIV